MVRVVAPATFMLTGFLGLDMALLAFDHTAVPKRDLVAMVFGLVLLTEGFDRKYHMLNKTGIPTPAMRRDMDKIFHVLSALEVITTILAPWGMILYERFYSDNVTGKDSVIYALASHLFIFQTQIASESIIMSGGAEQRWMLFPFTVLANVYRLVPLLTWLSRSGVTSGQPAWEHPLPIIGLVLWLFSSFYFIPFVWWPVLKKARQEGPEKLE